MDNELSQQEISDFIERGAHVAHVATVRPDGRPHVAPVSFGSWDGKAYAMIVDGAVKLNNIRHNPKVALSIATDERPYKYVVLEGEGRITEDNREQVLERILIGYVGTERGRALTREVLASLGRLRVLEVPIDKVISHMEGGFSTLKGRSIKNDGREFGQPWLEADPS